MSFLINPFAHGDPYWANVALLVKCDGTDASTSFTDLSDGAKAITANGSAQVDTAQSKFGGASALFDGTGDFLSVPDSADWDFGSGNFTIEMFVRFNALANRACLIGQRADSNNVWHLFIDFTDSLGGIFRYTNGGAIQIRFVQGDTTGWSTGTWYHVCLERSGTTFRIYRDGAIVASTTDADSMPTLAGALTIGSGLGDAGGTSNDLNGWIDELRISKGIARYNGAFTPPSAAFNSTPADMTLSDDAEMIGQNCEMVDVYVTEKAVGGSPNPSRRIRASLDGGGTWATGTLQDSWVYTDRQLFRYACDVSAQLGGSPTNRNLKVEYNTLNDGVERNFYRLDAVPIYAD